MILASFIVAKGKILNAWVAAPSPNWMTIYDSSGVFFFFLFGFLIMLDIKIQRNLYGAKYKKKKLCICVYMLCISLDLIYSTPIYN